MEAFIYLPACYCQVALVGGVLRYFVLICVNLGYFALICVVFLSGGRVFALSCLIFFYSVTRKA